MSGSEQGALIVTGFMMRTTAKPPLDPPIGTVWTQPLPGDVPVEIRRAPAGEKPSRWFTPGFDGSFCGAVWDDADQLTGGEPVQVVITGEPHARPAAARPLAFGAAS